MELCSSCSVRVPSVFDFGDVPVVRVVMTEVCVSSSFNGCWALIAVQINAFGQDAYTHLYRPITELNRVCGIAAVCSGLKLSRYIIEAKVRCQRHFL